MDMGSSEEIVTIKPEGEIYTCPACQYKDGFHVSFDLREASGEGRIILICPSCHRRFTIGWDIHLRDEY